MMQPAAGSPVCLSALQESEVGGVFFFSFFLNHGPACKDLRNAASPGAFEGDLPNLEPI